MEVEFRIEEKVKGTHGGRDPYPHDGIPYPSHEIEETIQDDWLVRGLSLVLISYDYIHTW